MMGDIKLFSALGVIVVCLACLRAGRLPWELLPLLKLAHRSIITARAFVLWTRVHLWRGIRREWQLTYGDCVQYVRRSQ